MALIVDQHSRGGLKHFCKICKKGFGCGRALGGHMRAHGIGDESTDHMEDEEEEEEDDDDVECPTSEINNNNNNTNNHNKDDDNDDNIVGPTDKRMYALRTNPNRLKSTRVCENCGREFLSWKSFLDHENGKCTSIDDADSLIDANFEDYGAPIRDGTTSNNVSKRKRSFRAKIIGNPINNNYNNNDHHCPSSEEEDLANCLMMLSNANVDNPLLTEPEESSASASKDEEYYRMNYPINFVPPTTFTYQPDINKAKGITTTTNTKGLFECKACKKVFNSHQALGGHRASHKKVKGCFAARLDNQQNDGNLVEDDITTQQEQQNHQDDASFFPNSIMTPSSNFKFEHGSNSNNNIVSTSSKRRAKVHECSICHRVFSSGQALGGHKRCHWITSNSSSPTNVTVDHATSLAARFQQFQDHFLHIQHRPKFTTTTNTTTTTRTSNNNNNNKNEPIDLTLDLNISASTTSLVRHLPTSCLQLSTNTCLQSLMGKEMSKDPNCHDDDSGKGNSKTNNKNNNKNGNETLASISETVEDEVDSKVKLAKLSELKDTKVNESSSPWLQVGIGSTTNVAAKP